MGFFIIGLCFFFVIMVIGYGGLVVYVVIFGFFEVCYILLILLVISDIVGFWKMFYVFGSVFIVMVFLMFLGFFIVGLF